MSRHRKDKINQRGGPKRRFIIIFCFCFQKQIDSLNELASNLNELIKNAREDWEGEQNEGNATHLILLNGGFSVSRTLNSFKFI